MPPSAIAGVSVVCALGPWVFSETTVLRALAAAAAATAVVGAVVMRRWDAQAGKRVAELTRARVGDEWRYEERVAELETDLEESRELRAKLEQRLRAKRAELAGLRNEHAALLRRYATAETERATALEGRRLLEIEAAEPSSPPALPPARRAEPVPAGVAEADEAAEPAAIAGEDREDSGDEPTACAVFSPEGGRLYRQALTALARFGGEAPADAGTEAAEASTPAVSETAAAEAVAAEGTTAEGTAAEDTAAEGTAAEDTAAEGTAAEGTAADDIAAEEIAAGDTAVRSAVPEIAETSEIRETPEAFGTPEPHESGTGEPEAAEAGAVAEAVPAGRTGGRRSAAGVAGSVAAAGAAAQDARDGVVEGGVTDGTDAARGEAGAPAAQEDEAQGQPVAAGGHARAAAEPMAPAEPAKPVGQPAAGHFTVPTAVAVVPSAPARRQAVEGGFDFFGTQKGGPKAALDSVHNEDLADVVGEEALAVHKAESEAGFKQADAQSLGAGQVIDLTAHDETEQIDVQGLRSAAS
ncbi:hypothetical protein GCM10010260_50330 [Streptomyces filipinensis]|uniref:Secreted protein n=1 Tax=Streptomyces filipinensis TaxID=66887 RepID=A0A918MCC9_9ACTN|nr:hypothetical protein GCM10010260_50330 [Streptomyces filipinensis]